MFRARFFSFGNTLILISTNNRMRTYYSNEASISSKIILKSHSFSKSKVEEVFKCLIYSLSYLKDLYSYLFRWNSNRKDLCDVFSTFQNVLYLWRLIWFKEFWSCRAKNIQRNSVRLVCNKIFWYLFYGYIKKRKKSHL